jgi:hypothetical protein
MRIVCQLLAQPGAGIFTEEEPKSNRIENRQRLSKIEGGKHDRQRPNLQAVGTCVCTCI